MFIYCCVSLLQACACVKACVCLSVASDGRRGDTNSRPSPCFGAKPQLTVTMPPNPSFKQAICHAVSLPFQLPGQLTPCKHNQPTSQPPGHAKHTRSLTHKRNIFTCRGLRYTCLHTCGSARTTAFD